MADGRLTASAVTFSFVATPALAEVCDKERPAWSPADGPVGALGEAGYVLLSPFGAVLACLILLALWLNGWWPWAIILVLATLRLWLLLPGEDIGGVAAFAVAEGCVGPRYLAQSALTSVVLWATFMMFRRPSA